MTYQILQGDALTILRTLESESVQCCITSPPYYGLRSYGTEPQVWGNHNGCEHVWSKFVRRGVTGTDSPKLAIKGSANFQRVPDSEQAFCLSCNAWRGELGLEPTFQLYIAHLTEIFAEVRRVLKKDGTMFVNLGDSYGHGTTAGRVASTTSVLGETQHNAQNSAARNGAPAKSLLNIPARFAIAMTDELKMIQRNEIIWYKRACMPSSAKDRFTVDFEKIFFFSKEPRYKFNQQLEPTSELTNWTYPQPDKAARAGITNNGTGQSTLRTETDNRNKRCVWDVPFEPSGDEHYASYPTKLVEPMILAGTDEGDTVLDIFNGTATTGLTALRNRRNYIGIELNEKYIGISNKRLAEVQVKLFT